MVASSLAAPRTDMSRFNAFRKSVVQDGGCILSFSTLMLSRTSINGSPASKVDTCGEARYRDVRVCQDRVEFCVKRSLQAKSLSRLGGCTLGTFVHGNRVEPEGSFMRESARAGLASAKGLKNRDARRIMHEIASAVCASAIWRF